MRARLVPPLLHNFLAKQLELREPLGVSASSLLKLEAYQRMFWKQGQGILGVRNQSVLIPIDVLAPEDFPRDYLNSFRKKGFAIFGPPSWIAPWEKYYGLPWRWMDYHFMARAPTPLRLEETAQVEDFIINKATKADFSLLWPLQKEYELEEVVFEQSDFNEKRSGLSFYRDLTVEHHWFGRLGSQVVCKASTNARGIKWVQIGGVYTIPTRRRSGLAYLLFRHLIDYFRERSLGVCLFAKKTNQAALGLYRKLGFQIVDDYRIVYYR